MTSISPWRPASATAPRASAPSACLVDLHADGVLAREREELVERSDVTRPCRTHRRWRSGSRGRRTGSAHARLLGAGVAVGEDVGPGEPAAVDDRAVAELVVQDDLAAAGERGD